jgi:hypothetical protein
MIFHCAVLAGGVDGPALEPRHLNTAFTDLGRFAQKAARHYSQRVLQLVLVIWARPSSVATPPRLLHTFRLFQPAFSQTGQSGTSTP